MKEVYDILDKIQKKEINIANLSEETGIPAQRIYKWQQRGKSDISLKDAIELQKWVAKMDKSKNLKTNNQIENPGKAAEDGREDLNETISSLARSNEVIARANEKLADANYDLVQMLKRKETIPSANEVDTIAVIAKEIVAQIGPGLRWKNVEAFRKEWSVPAKTLHKT